MVTQTTWPLHDNVPTFHLCWGQIFLCEWCWIFSAGELKFLGRQVGKWYASWGIEPWQKACYWGIQWKRQSSARMLRVEDSIGDFSHSLFPDNLTLDSDVLSDIFWLWNFPFALTRLSTFFICFDCHRSSWPTCSKFITFCPSSAYGSYVWMFIL